MTDLALPALRLLFAGVTPIHYGMLFPVMGVMWVGIFVTAALND